MDTPNIFKDDTDLNIVKSWLCNSTDGQTYSINGRFLPRIKIPEGLDWDFCDIDAEWNEIIGWKHDYKVDDPEMEEAAKSLLADIEAFIAKVNSNPQKYFKSVRPPLKSVEGWVMEGMPGKYLHINQTEDGNGTWWDWTRCIYEAYCTEDLDALKFIAETEFSDFDDGFPLYRKVRFTAECMDTER